MYMYIYIGTHLNGKVLATKNLLINYQWGDLFKVH